MVFKELNPKIQEWLKAQGYLEPSLPQTLSLKDINDGKDVLILAPTGHGKTLAAVLPLFHQILMDKNRKKISMLYITPLKSLNRDIFDRIVKLGSSIGLDIDLRHGDTSQKVRSQQLADPADVLVTTPETIQAVLSGKKFREHLKNIRYVVVDEIHELCENKRGTQLTLGLQRLEHLIGHNFQRIGLSATIGDPEKISKFLTRNECKIVDARAEKKYDIKISHPKPGVEDITLSKQLKTVPNVAYCLRKIKGLVESSKSSIIFVNTRQTAESLGSKFKNWDPDFPIAVHHSSLSKDVRIDVENRFKKGELKSIISTSSLELGIDVGNIDLIIQYGSPRQATKLIQRVGRSGHGVGRVSRGEIICSSIDDYLEASAIVKKINDNWLEKPRIPEKPFDVLAHQIVGICMDYQKDEKNPTKEEIFDIIKKAYPYRNLTMKELVSLLDLMKDIYLIWNEGNGFYRTRKGMMYYFENLSTIPNEKTYSVISSDMNKKIGVLHQGFVAQYIKRNAEFIMHGDPWKVVDQEEDKIFVVSGGNMEGAIPSWEGELIPVAMEVAKVAGNLRENFDFSNLKEQKEKFVVPTGKRMYLESFENYVILHSCFGSKVNQTLAKTIGTLISSRIGSSIGVRTDTYRIMFKMPELFGQETVLECIQEIEPNWVDAILKKSIKNSSIFAFRFYQIAKRFGVIEKYGEFSSMMISKLIDIYQNTPIYQETLNELFREKLDITNTEKVIGGIKNGKIELITSSGYTVSPIGAEGLDYSSVSLIKPKEKVKEIYDLVKKRLLKRRFWFACLNCGQEIGTYTAQSLPDDMSCPKCEAKLIGFIPAKDMELAKKVLKKYVNKRKLTHEERDLHKKFSETSELFLNYGKQSVFVLAGYGIGPTVGRRILGRFHKTEEDIVKDIAAAERSFIETRMFWT